MTQPTIKLTKKEAEILDGLLLDCLSEWDKSMHSDEKSAIRRIHKKIKGIGVDNATHDTI